MAKTTRAPKMPEAERVEWRDKIRDSAAKGDGIPARVPVEALLDWAYHMPIYLEAFSNQVQALVDLFAADVEEHTGLTIHDLYESEQDHMEKHHKHH